MADILIRGGTVVTADSMGPTDVLIRDGKIAQKGTGLETDGSIFDATGQWVMPGGIDTHTHLDHPIGRLGVRTADDFHVGTIAGACGGVTTIIDFSLQDRGESLLKARDRRLGEIEPNSIIDYSFHTIVTDVNPNSIKEVESLVESGFPSFKVYMTYGDKKVGDGDLLLLLEELAAKGGLAYLHCENDCAVTHLIERHISRGETGPSFHASSRPVLVEAEATNRAIMLAEIAGAPICIAHVTSKLVAGHLEEARGRGQPVVGETCPQYLVLNDAVYDPEGGFEVAKFVCSPPIRDIDQVEALWSTVEDGLLQQVSSDHAPFHYEDQKTKGRDNFTRIPNGLPGIETRLPLMFTYGVKAGRISPSRFVELTSTNPARIFGMYPNKGSLKVGADADIVIVDPNKEVELSAGCLHSAVDYTPYQGLRVSGFPTTTFSRGEVIVQDGEVVAKRGRGHLVRRQKIDPKSLP